MMNRFYNFGDYWNLYHKVTFDPVSRLVIVNKGETNISMGRDVYSAFKEWFSINENSQYLPTIRTIGGDPTVSGNFAGTIYFFINGWRMFLDKTVNISGSVFSDDFPSPYISSPTAHLAFSQVANLVDRVETNSSGGSEFTPAEIAAAVWKEPSENKAPGTMGKLVRDVDQKTDDTQAIVIATKGSGGGTVTVSKSTWERTEW